MIFGPGLGRVSAGLRKSLDNGEYVPPPVAKKYAKTVHGARVVFPRVNRDPRESVTKSMIDRDVCACSTRSFSHYDIFTLKHVRRSLSYDIRREKVSRPALKVSPPLDFLLFFNREN